jgi:two-component system cell cycle response regulator DivK
MLTAKSTCTHLVKLLVTESGENWPLSGTGMPGGNETARVLTNKNRKTTDAKSMYGATHMVGEDSGPGAAPAQPKTVLIVEDNELNMKLFNDILEAQGYRVLQTRDGLSALDIARAHMPDLILMDIQLPEVSGIEVTKWLKEDEALRSIPVIAVTAFAMKGDEEKIREGGCEAYISKPISVMSFLQTIDGFLKDPAK